MFLQEGIMIKNILFAGVYLIALFGLVKMHKPPTAVEKDRGWTRATRGGGVSLLTFADHHATEDEIKADIMKMLKLHGQYWSVDNINTVAKVLQFGNNHKDYRIDYKLVLGYFGHESKMCVIPSCSTSPPNKNGTVDYGLGQHNSDYIRQRWIQARWVAQQYDIIPGRAAGGDYFDVMTQSVATIQYLKENRDRLDTYGKANNVSYGLRDWILVYNLGWNGYHSNSKDEKWNNKYVGLVTVGYKYLSGNDHYASYVTGEQL